MQGYWWLEQVYPIRLWFRQSRQTGKSVASVLPIAQKRYASPHFAVQSFGSCACSDWLNGWKSMPLYNKYHIFITSVCNGTLKDFVLKQVKLRNNLTFVLRIFRSFHLLVFSCKIFQSNLYFYIESFNTYIVVFFLWSSYFVESCSVIVWLICFLRRFSKLFTDLDLAITFVW